MGTRLDELAVFCLGHEVAPPTWSETTVERRGCPCHPAAYDEPATGLRWDGAHRAPTDPYAPVIDDAVVVTVAVPQAAYHLAPGRPASLSSATSIHALKDRASWQSSDTVSPGGTCTKGTFMTPGASAGTI